jgi:hypothetical protein
VAPRAPPATAGDQREDLRGPSGERSGRGPGGGRKKTSQALAAEKSAEIGRLAAQAAASLGCDAAGLGAAEAVIRAGMLPAGASLLERLLAADPGLPRPARGLRARP